MTETNNIQISNIQNDEEYVQAFMLCVGEEETQKLNYNHLNLLSSNTSTLIAKKSNEVIGLLITPKDKDTNELSTEIFVKEEQDQSYISNILQKHIKKEVQDQDKNKIKEGKKENTSKESN